MGNSVSLFGFMMMDLPDKLTWPNISISYSDVLNVAEKQAFPRLNVCACIGLCVVWGWALDKEREKESTLEVF